MLLLLSPSLTKDAAVEKSCMRLDDDDEKARDSTTTSEVRRWLQRDCRMKRPLRDERAL
mgnify:CR=1 FL=1